MSITKLIKGIRILDKINGYVGVSLKDILEEVPNGNAFKWSVIYISGIGLLRSKRLLDLEDELEFTPSGLIMDWNDLNELVEIEHNIEDLEVIGCSDATDLKHYNADQEMYESCDFTITFFDSSFWEVFSKDESFIAKLASKFKDVEFINSDFRNEYEN